MRNATALRGLSITLAALAHFDNGERVRGLTTAAPWLIARGVSFSSRIPMEQDRTRWPPCQEISLF